MADAVAQPHDLTPALVKLVKATEVEEDPEQVGDAEKEEGDKVGDLPLQPIPQCYKRKN